MCNDESKSYLTVVLIFGAVWGFAEAALGMWLGGCASFYSGAVMTGVALFFISGSWILIQNIFGIALLIIIASVFKLFDALLLSLPLNHGAVANPIFAFFMEGIAFLILIFIFNEKLKKKKGGQALLGGMAALLAVNLFPLVKYATGIPACVFPGTGYPLSLYYAPLAVFLSLLTVPLGILTGERIKAVEIKLDKFNRAKKLRYFVTPVILIFCLAVIAWIRLG